ncbi:MFS transporter [Rhodoplanes sp. Z2-YC6860]|uniref:MFS transporter n=1 Tax=Rhodoplanes sp. Z2-YC6860 TaxID=674703 RepID=UPI00078C8AD7|nr:MFS transporter [Rhodoplanes sp. Z2-YC6860]AMN39672.1 drug resistance transporter, Bcr/CflA subfamily protein [Rhodoplanes sp. Z2-YC6860]
MPFRALNIILAALALLGPFSIHLFFPVIPVIKADFALSDALAQLTFSIGVFGMAFSTLAYGAFADRYGRRPVLLVGLLLFLAGSVLSAFAFSFTGLLIGRILQSIGAGSGITLARAIARDVYGAEGLVKSIAYLTMFFALGALVAPGFGGFLIDQAGWRSVFYFASTIGFLIALGSYFVVPETGKRATAGGGMSGLAGFIALLRYPRFCALVVHTGCSTGTFLIVATASSSLMKEALHRSATEFGLYFAMVPFGFVTGTIISSRVGNRASVERMILIGACIAVAAVSIQSGLLLSGHFTPLVLFLPGTFITLAQGISLPFAQSGAMATIPRLAGTAAGIGVFSQNFLGAGFAQIYGLLADGSPYPMMVMTAATATLGMISAIIPSLLSRSRPQPS